MWLASEAQARDFKIGQKDRARVVQKVAFFATAGRAWGWGLSFRSRRSAGNIGNHRNRHALAVLPQCVSSKGRRDAIASAGLAFTFRRQDAHKTHASLINPRGREK